MSYRNSHGVQAAPNVSYKRVRGDMKYVPFLYRKSNGDRVQLNAYTTLESAVQAKDNLLASNDTLTATDASTHLEDC